TRSKLDAALTEAQAAAAMDPRDGEIHAEIGEIYQRMHRFDEAANAYTNFINLLPNKDRSDKAMLTKSQVKFLQAFEGRAPLDFGMSVVIDYQHRQLTMARSLPSFEGGEMLLPMRIHRLAMVRGMLNSTRPTYFVVDTGGEVISISSETAGHFQQKGQRRIP